MTQAWAPRKKEALRRLRRDGAYIVHVDSPPSCWWKNFVTGDTGTWCAKNGDTTPEEREILRQRMERDRAAREKAQAERYARGAEKARRIWSQSRVANPKHPYLVAKGINRVGDILQKGNDLVIPVLDAQGEIRSIQFIAPAKDPSTGRDKTFLSDGKIAGGYFPIKDQADDDRPLLICEGYATGASLHHASGYVSLPPFAYSIFVAFTAGNLEAVARMARERYPEREIIVCADNDLNTPGNPGVTKATEAARAIGGKVAVPVLPNGGKADFNDLHQAAGAKEVMNQVHAATAPSSEENHSFVSSGDDDQDLDDYVPIAWPVLDKAAMPGMVGDFIRLATKDSEADPAAVLATFLTRFGAECFVNMPRRGPVFYVGETRHHPRLFSAIVGASSKARKGTSAKPVMNIFDFSSNKSEEDLLDLDFSTPDHELYAPATCTGGPLSTGEGLAYAVRDPRREWRVDKKTGDGQWVNADPGVEDKRLFVLDEELAAMLRCTKREGNTISEAIRSFWDSGSYSPLTKANRVTTTNAHVCIVTHCTSQELKTVLDDVQAWNGFANRFLWVCARRQKIVPEPRRMDPMEVKKIQDELLLLVKYAQDCGVMKFSREARELWREVYPELSKEHPGLAGVIINRGEAQTIRLSMLFALLEGCHGIEANHLASALAFWRYCEQSALFIFGAREADPVAQKIMDALNENPKTATEINNALGGHVTKSKIKSTLEELIAAGKILVEQVKTTGRPRTIFSLRKAE